MRQRDCFLMVRVEWKTAQEALWEKVPGDHFGASLECIVV